MKTKKIKVKVDTTFKYIQIFNGIFGLTDTEIEILAEFIDAKIRLDKAGITMNAFSTEIKKQVATKLGRDDFNTLNNYIKKLKEKGAIIPDGDGYRILPLFITTGESQITFELQRQNENN
jgi:hypothetical protein